MVIQGTVGFCQKIYMVTCFSWEWKIMVHDNDGKFDRIPSVKFKGHSSDLVLQLDRVGRVTRDDEEHLLQQWLRYQTPKMYL